MKTDNQEAVSKEIAIPEAMGASPEVANEAQSTRRNFTLVSLFSGAGGLDLGLEAAGFENRLCIEVDDDARSTIRHNRPDWRLAEPGCIHELIAENDHAELCSLAGIQARQLTLLAGGPPCQPFSKSSYWVHGDAPRMADPRARTLSAYLTFVEAFLPEVLLLENVEGMIFEGKDDGLAFLKRGLRGINKRHGTKYAFSVIKVNAADYGVPQARLRVFAIACRNGTLVGAPPQTHGPDGDPVVMRGNLQRHRTAWDAIGDLELASDEDDLALTGKWAELLPSIPEGNNYLWHTDRMGGLPLFGWRTRYWSFLLKLAKDTPSWTLQAQPGPATGPFHWRNRLLSKRELARIQSFPDGYSFHGTYRSVRKQIGNAVPPLLAEIIGRHILATVLACQTSGSLRYSVSTSGRAPRRFPVRAVPNDFLHLAGEHAPHPGNGLGPRAKSRGKRKAKAP